MRHAFWRGVLLFTSLLLVLLLLFMLLFMLVHANVICRQDVLWKHLRGTGDARFTYFSDSRGVVIYDAYPKVSVQCISKNSSYISCAQRGFMTCLTLLSIKRQHSSKYDSVAILVASVRWYMYRGFLSC